MNQFSLTDAYEQEDHKMQGTINNADIARLEAHPFFNNDGR